MGAVTGLMHADRDPSIAGLVLDSPFSNLRTLAEELAKENSVRGLAGILAIFSFFSPPQLEAAIFRPEWGNGFDPQDYSEQSELRYRCPEPDGER
jgi:hypothetical protein